MRILYLHEAMIKKQKNKLKTQLERNGIKKWEFKCQAHSLDWCSLRKESSSASSWTAELRPSPACWARVGLYSTQLTCTMKVTAHHDSISELCVHSSCSCPWTFGLSHVSIGTTHCEHVRRKVLVQVTGGGLLIAKITNCCSQRNNDKA